MAKVESSPVAPRPGDVQGIAPSPDGHDWFDLLRAARLNTVQLTVEFEVNGRGQIVGEPKVVGYADGVREVGLSEQVQDLTAKLKFLLARTPTEDGTYTFPDGETWDAAKRTKPVEVLSWREFRNLLVRAYGKAEERYRSARIFQDVNPLETLIEEIRKEVQG